MYYGNGEKSELTIFEMERSIPLPDNGSPPPPVKPLENKIPSFFLEFYGGVAVSVKQIRVKVMVGYLIRFVQV